MTRRRLANPKPPINPLLRKRLAARDSPGNLLLHRIVEEAERLAELCDEYAESHPDDCACPWCSHRTRTEDPHWLRRDVETLGYLLRRMFKEPMESDILPLPRRASSTEI